MEDIADATALPVHNNHEMAMAVSSNPAGVSNQSSVLKSQPQQRQKQEGSKPHHVHQRPVAGGSFQFTCNVGNTTSAPPCLRRGHFHCRGCLWHRSMSLFLKAPQFLGNGTKQKKGIEGKISVCDRRGFLSGVQSGLTG